jgi:hypothetical protein
VTAARDPWTLPAAAAFLDEVEAAHDAGLAIVCDDPAMPAAWMDALAARLRLRTQDVLAVQVEAGCSPATAIADQLGCSPQLQAFLDSRHYGTSAIVDLAPLVEKAHNEWWTFLARFWEARDRAGAGISLIIAGVKPTARLPSGLEHIVWGSRLRRLDVAIWADMHAPDERAEPLASLATALGVELCGWRLDLVSEIVRAGRDDLIDPISWLERREAVPIEGPRRFSGTEMRCAIELVRMGGRAELERRTWRAHLTALFPWIEDLRQDAISRHRKLLRIDDHLRALGVRDIEEIELGALAWQLRTRVAREEAVRLECLARIRNALAHRKPASPEDLEQILKASARQL